MEEKEWQMGLFHKVQELVKRYSLKAPDPNDRSQIVCKDNSVIDAVWQAGIDFLVERGVYCYDTRRVIGFTEEEVKETVKGMPRSLTIGEGKDAVVVKNNRIGGREGCTVICGGFHTPLREDIAHLAPKAFMIIPGVDYMQGFTFKEVEGREVHGTAIACYAARRQVDWMRQGARKAGRPGMAICYYPISLEAAAMIAPLDPRNGLRPCDGSFLTPLPDIMVESGLISAAVVYRDYGLSFIINGNGHGEQDSFAGSLEGYMVTGVAKTIAGWMVYRANITNMSPNIVHQAIDRHTNMVRVHGVRTPYDIPRPYEMGTERYLLHYANYAISCAIFGSGTEPSGGGRLEGLSPYEIEFMCECAEAARDLSIDDGLELMRSIRKMADEECPAPPPSPERTGIAHRALPTGWNGSMPTVRDVYDLVKMEPSESYRKEMAKARRLVKDAGLEID
jgi:methylamine--corrinoid protein Co-methyltransferase